MPLITATDIYSRIYAENVTEITRGDDTITSRAIDGAIEEAQMYLTKFDLVALFGTPDIAPSVNSPFLKQLTVDLACWQLIRLGNPNIDYESAKNDYENAVRKLKDIQSGKAMPQAWPYSTVSNSNIPDGNAIEWTSRKKRHNYM